MYLGLLSETEPPSAHRLGSQSTQLASCLLPCMALTLVVTELGLIKCPPTPHPVRVHSKIFQSSVNNLGRKSACDDLVLATVSLSCVFFSGLPWSFSLVHLPVETRSTLICH
jgi:hypothetical protein